MPATATPPVDDLAALVQLEQLEERRDRATLAKLAELYTQRAALASDYAHLQDCAARLRDASAQYDGRLQKSTADALAEQLTAAGVVTWEPYSGANADQLREAAAVCARLASVAREAGRSTQPR